MHGEFTSKLVEIDRLLVQGRERERHWQFLDLFTGTFLRAKISAFKNSKF